MLLIQNQWPGVAGVLCLLLLAAVPWGSGEDVSADESVLLQTVLASSSGVEAEDRSVIAPAAASARSRRRMEERLSPSAMRARATALAGPRAGIKQDEPFRQAMVNFGDAQYIGYFTIGHQLVGGIIDTGSFELVIFSSVCSSCGAAAEYNPWLSSSYSMGKLKTTHTYGSGDVSSEEANDLVSIGPFPDTNQYFWEVTKATMPILYSAAFQAIIGIGPPETPASDAWEAIGKAAAGVSEVLGANKRPDQDMMQKVSDNLEVAMELSTKAPMLQNFNVSYFSLCIGRRPGSDGFFIWNDYNAIRHPDVFKRVQVVGRHSWSVWLDSVRINGMNEDGKPNSSSVLSLGCTEGCSAVIDSGTSLLAVPGFIKSKLEAIMSRINNDCSNLQEFPDLVFNMGGHTFSLPPDAYIAEVVGAVPNYLKSYVKIMPRQIPFEPKTRCQLLLMESYASTSYGPLWILGVPFFRKYYTTFHIGESRSQRSLFIAPASRDCKPAMKQAALYSRGSSTHWKTAPASMLGLDDIPKVEAAKINVPPIARRAAMHSYIDL